MVSRSISFICSMSSWLTSAVIEKIERRSPFDSENLKTYYEISRIGCQKGIVVTETLDHQMVVTAVTGNICPPVSD